MTRESNANDGAERPRQAPTEGFAPRERVLWNTIAIVITRAIAGAFHVLAGLKMARQLGSRGWGLFGYLISSIEVFRVVANFGLDVVAVRILAVGTHGPRAVLRHLLVLKTAMGVVVAGIVLALTFVIDGFAAQRGLMMLLTAGLLPVAFTQSASVRFQAEHVMDRLIPVNLVSGAVYLGGVYAASWAGSTVGTFVVIFVGFETLTLLLTLAAVRWTWPDRRREPPGPISSQLLRTIFRQGVPVGLVGLLVALYSRLGVLFLERFWSLAAVGQFYIALRIGEPLHMIAGALSMTTLPVLSRLAEQRQIVELRSRFLRYSLRPLLLSCGIAALISFYSRELLSLIKAEYADASGALIALAWATVCMFQNQISTTVVNAFGKFHYVTIFAAVNLCTFLALSLQLIPRMGPTGAGLSTLGTEGFNTLMQLVTVAMMVRARRVA